MISQKRGCVSLHNLMEIFHISNVPILIPNRVSLISIFSTPWCNSVSAPWVLYIIIAAVIKTIHLTYHFHKTWSDLNISGKIFILLFSYFVFNIVWHLDILVSSFLVGPWFNLVTWSVDNSFMQSLVYFLLPLIKTLSFSCFLTIVMSFSKNLSIGCF